MADSRDIAENAPPINTLPPEILSAIFLYTVEIWRFKQLLPFLVTLSHVCKHWRQVAISDPRLWSSVTLFSNKSIPCVKEWLSRSGAAPIDVRIDLYDTDQAGNVNATWIKEAIAMFVPRALQFRSLFIFTYREVNVHHILQLFEHAKAPLLERISVHSGGVRGDLSELGSFTTDNNRSAFGEELPVLTFAEFEPRQCILPLANITTLHLVGTDGVSVLNFSYLVKVLQTPHNLVSLSLRGDSLRESWPSHYNHPHVVLPNLRNLEIMGMAMTGLWLLLSISAPNLESLRWQVYGGGLQQLRDSPQFKPGVGKFPRMKYLNLQFQSRRPDEVSALMRTFPTVTHVFFSHPLGYYGGHHGGLSDSVSPFPGWANLEVLAVRMYNVWNCEFFAEETQTILLSCPNVRKLLVDAELLSYLNKTAPTLKGMVELELLTTQKFPDYWWISRREDNPTRI